MSGQVAGMQVGIQGISAITGVILVRTLAKDQYAWFAVASSLLATLNLLADGGTSTALTSVGSRVYREGGRFARLLEECLAVATRLTPIAWLLTLPLFLSLLIKLEVPLATAIGAICVAALCTLPSIYCTLMGVAHRVHARAQIVQLAEMVGASSRLIFTSSVLLGGWISMLGALVATLGASALQFLYIRGQTTQLLAQKAFGESFIPDIHQFIRSLYPNHLFYCIQGQVATWMISWFGDAADVADLSALGRLGVIVTVVTLPFHYLAIPALARIQDVRTLRRRIVLAVVAAAFLLAAILGVCVVWPKPLLWVLGTDYAHLSSELPLALAPHGILLINTLCWSLLIMRRWIKHASISIPLTLVGYAIGASFFDLSTVAGTLSFSAVSLLPNLAVGVAVLAFRLRAVV